MKFHEWGVGVDPDESCWVESVKFNVSFLVVIRVFFCAGPSAHEEIGDVFLRVGPITDVHIYYNRRLF